MKFCRLTNFISKYQINDVMHNSFYRCLDLKNKIYVACKIVNKKSLTASKLVQLNNEIKLLYLIQNHSQPKLQKIYEDDNYVYLVFQYFHGDELVKIISQYKMKELAVATFAYHILKCLKKLHDANIYHGNLTLDNLVFCSNSKDKELYILNQRFVDTPDDEFYSTVVNNGLNMCAAPECITKSGISLASDMFSLGSCLFYMMFGKYPYKHITPNGSKGQPFEIDVRILSELKEINKKCLKG